MKIILPVFFLSCVLSVLAAPAAAQAYARGHYIDTGGSRHDGQIRYQLGLSYLDFRETPKSESERLKPDEVQAFVWGIDSFLVRQGGFLRVVVSDGPLLLYVQEKTEQVSGSKTIDGRVTHGYGLIHRTFLLERPGTGELIVLERKDKKFQQQMSELFAADPELVARIEAGEFPPGNADRLVKEYNERQRPK